MRVSYCEGYYVSLPEQHPFPMGKFPALRDILLREGLIQEKDMVGPEQAAWDDLRLIHSEDYLDKLARGGLSRKEERRLGLPWSAALVRRSRLAVGGTLQAARMALEDAIAANLAGGTHHAFPGFGEGFCVLNDVAVTIAVLRREEVIERALVIDLDVHQGNGTAAACQGEEAVYTFSMHGEKNFPFVKECSSLDVGLGDGLTDGKYAEILAAHLPQVLEAARADIVFYLAGVDPVVGDRYGRLALSRSGLRARERMVLEQVKATGAALVLLLSGGYAPTPQQTADLHAEVHRVARELYGTNERKKMGEQRKNAAGFHRSR